MLRFLLTLDLSNRELHLLSAKHCAASRTLTDRRRSASCLCYRSPVTVEIDPKGHDETGVCTSRRAFFRLLYYKGA